MIRITDLTNGRISTSFCLTALLLFTAAVYYPGLDSLFLLDDQANLKDLAEINTRGIGFYLFGSSAGPGGRPLSLLTFALQYQSWPADPFAFKLVNLLLHLINGILVFFLCRRLVGPDTKIIPASLWFTSLVTGVWLLHPLQLSTVLYVIQRMTILSTIFMLAGMLVYLTGRRIYLVDMKWRTILFTLTGVYGFMLLAILSKESGILLALYLLVFEFTLLPKVTTPGKWRKYAVPALLLPLLGLGLYLFRDIDGFLGSYQIRNFTLGERLLTEANVLIDYLRLIAAPVSGAFSLFHDDYPVATSLLVPGRTVGSIVILMFLGGAALYFRKRARLFSFAVLWFFAGHLLESSFISLELYFEHRNYLPLLGPVIFFCKLLSDLPDRFQRHWPGIALAGIWPLAILMVSVMEINLWNNSLLQAHVWTRQHPQSKRALNHMLNMNLILDEREGVMDALERLRRLDPADIYPSIKSITIANCYRSRELSGVEWSAMLEEAGVAKPKGVGATGELQELVRLNIQGSCPLLEKENLSALVDALIANPEFQPVLRQLYDVAANLAWLRQAPEAALDYLDRLIVISPGIDRDIFRLKMLIAAKQYPSAAALLQEIREQLVTSPRARLFYGEQLGAIEKSLAGIDPH